MSLLAPAGVDSDAGGDLVPTLKALGLTALGATLPTVLEQARHQQPTYDAFLRLALQAEVTGRAERAHARRLRAARLPARKTLESFDFRFQPSVPERLIRELATLGFVETATNLIFLGPPGVGKPHPPDYPSRPHVLADRCGHGH